MNILRKHARVAFAILVTIIGCGAAPNRSDNALERELKERETVIESMESELARSVKNLKFRDYEPPYFVSYGIKDTTQHTVAGRFGALTHTDTARARNVSVEVRVGDYMFDNFANVEGESFRLNEFTASRRAPLNGDQKALRGTLWLLTDEAYKKAISDYLTKRGGAVYETDEKVKQTSFSKEPKVSYRGPQKPLEFEQKRWETAVKKITKTLTETDDIIDSEMDVTATRVVRYFVNSEGSTIVDEFTLYSIQIEAFARAEDGMLLENGRSYYARDAKNLPKTDKISSDVDVMVRELIALKNAPIIDPYTGPAILEPEASGVLFHEAVGHRLEGERQRDEEEGRTFKGRVGKKVIPGFLSVFDDPTLDVEAGIQLNGKYEYDDEGVKAARADLIKDGVLQTFLKSRTPIEDAPHSNGHGRSQGPQKPMARMANLVVSASSEKSHDRATLKKMLIAEVKKQGKPFGLIIRDITGGSTNTSGYGYQAFKGSPRLIYKVDPETGKETLVRGAELVGTPLASINKIVAASKETGVFNGYCGAESGYVPVSTIAPALLTLELELQRTQRNTERPPILAPPWKK